MHSVPGEGKDPRRMEGVGGGTGGGLLGQCKSLGWETFLRMRSHWRILSRDDTF